MSLHVVDASVAVKWFFPEAHSEEAVRLRTPTHALIAPDLLWLEVHNVVCRNIRRKLIAREKGLEVLSVLRSLPIQIIPTADLLDTATAIALDTATSLYDCIYVALAVLLDARMVTADRQLYRGIRSGPLAERVLWVGDLR